VDLLNTSKEGGNSTLPWRVIEICVVQRFVDIPVQIHGVADDSTP